MRAWLCGAAVLACTVPVGAAALAGDGKLAVTGYDGVRMGATFRFVPAGLALP